MNAYLNSQGYYYAQFKDSIHLDTVQDQIRVSALMDILPGKNITIDSVNYSLEDSNLQRIADQAQKSSLLLRGKPIANK